MRDFGIDTENLDALNERLEKSNRDFLENGEQEKKVKDFLFVKIILICFITYFLGVFTGIGIMLSAIN